MEISDTTRKRLIRYAKAVQQKEMKVRRVHFSNGDFVAQDNESAANEWYLSRIALKKCPEPSIKKLVRQIQIERLDEAGFNRVKVAKVVGAAFIADNELIALGHNLAN